MIIRISWKLGSIMIFNDDDHPGLLWLLLVIPLFHFVSSDDRVDSMMLWYAPCPPLQSWGNHQASWLSVGAGRPWLLHPKGYLGLLLFYLGSTMNNKHLCMIFGVMPAVCSWAIRTMLWLVIHWLSNHPIAQVKFFDHAKMREFANLIQARVPIVNNVIEQNNLEN